MRQRTRICTILARGGSKGLPGKNLRQLGGISLIGHAIEQARASKMFGAIAVSSDSMEILEAARRCGAENLVERPAAMATDDSSKLPAIQHCVLETERRLGLDFEIIVDLGVTAPLRLSSDIVEAVLFQEQKGVSLVVSATESHDTPYFNIVERDAADHVQLSKKLQDNIQRRQDGPKCFKLNGAIYVWRRDALMQDPRVFYPDTMIYEMPPERSVDIDTPFDFEFAEFLLSRRVPQ